MSNPKHREFHIPAELELRATEDAPLEKIQLRPLAASDGGAIADFAKSIPEHDLLFLRRDISNEKVVAAWIESIDRGDHNSFVACRNNTILACAGLFSDPLSWSRHVSEVRALVSPSARGRGLGRQLIDACFGVALARGCKKLVTQMTVDQTYAIGVFEELGFRAEALLKDHVCDQQGDYHDVVILACELETALAQQRAYGELL